MSSPLGSFGGGARRFALPTPPTGEEVASFATYEAAQDAVDRLAHADFPVQGLSIVGKDMQSVERVTGRLSWGRAAAGGAVSGLWLGFFFGLLIEITSSTAPVTLVGALLLGAAFGVLYGIASYAITRRRRDFSSVMQVIASSYSLLVAPDSVNRARNVLGIADPAPSPVPVRVAAPAADDEDDELEDPRPRA